MSMAPLVRDREWIRKHLISATLVVTLVVSALFHFATRTFTSEAVAVIGGAVIVEQSLARDVDAH